MATVRAADLILVYSTEKVSLLVLQKFGAILSSGSFLPV